MASLLPGMLKTLAYSGILDLGSELSLPAHLHLSKEWVGASDVE